MRISEYLLIGADNAKPIKELAFATGLSTRTIEHMICDERRRGVPICASSIDPAGYYLAKDQGEMERYCEALRHRAGEIFKTRRACQKSMAKLPPAPENMGHDDIARDRGH